MLASDQLVVHQDSRPSTGELPLSLSAHGVSQCTRSFFSTCRTLHSTSLNFLRCSLCLILHPAQVSMRGSSAICCVSYSVFIYRLAEVPFCPVIQVINEEVKHHWPSRWGLLTLGHISVCLCPSSFCSPSTFLKSSPTSDMSGLVLQSDKVGHNKRAFYCCLCLHLNYLFH